VVRREKIAENAILGDGRGCGKLWCCRVVVGMENL